jgi:dihydrofolate synthase / folylpolyglutamate synthase
MVKDKDILPVLHILPKHADYYFCQAKLPRAMEASALAAKAAEAGLHGRVVADVNDALNAARAAATADDLIFIGGSTFVVAEVEGL